MDGNNPSNPNNPNMFSNPNNRDNPNNQGNTEVPQPPQLVLQQSQNQPQNRSQMNVDTDNQSQHSQQSHPNQQNVQQYQHQLQQFQMMQLQQQSAAAQPSQLQGLHTPPAFAHSQPMVNPMAFNANPYAHYQQPQMVYSIPYQTAITNAQRASTGQPPDLSSTGRIIDAISDLMDQGLRESATISNDIKGISVGTFIEQLQRLIVSRTRNRREVSKLADALQFIIWKTVEELSPEEVDLCRNRNRNDSIPVDLLGASGDHTMVDRTELKEDPQAHPDQGIPTFVDLKPPKYITRTYITFLFKVQNITYHINDDTKPSEISRK